MILINRKAQLKPKWAKHCVLSATGNDNSNDNRNNIIFTMKDKKLYVPVVSLSAKELSKHLSNRFKKSVY